MEIDSTQEGPKWVGRVEVVDPRSEASIKQIHTMAMHNNPEDAERTVGTMAVHFVSGLESIE